MRILIIQERGHHDANRDFRESCCLKRSFDRLGHECVIWGKGHPNFGVVPEFDSYDIVLNLENYGEGWLPNLHAYPQPLKIVWCIDAHHRGEDVYEQMFTRDGYNILAHATLDFVRKPHHRWFPNCTDIGLMVPMPSLPKVHRIGFCGNYATEQRKRIVNALTDAVGMKQDIFVIGNDMVRTVNSYRIHFNLNIGNDINYRSFETLACETVLVTNHDHQYDKLGFVDGHNCFMYSGREIDTIVERIASVMGMEDAVLDEVAKRGRQLVLAHHTYDHRAAALIRFKESM